MKDEGWISGGIGIFLTGLVLFPVIVLGFTQAKIIAVIIFSIIFLVSTVSLIVDIINWNKEE